MRKVGTVVLDAIMWLLSKMPLKVHYAFSRMFSWLFGTILHYRRDVVTINIARSFPDKKYKEISQIVKQFYGHIGDIIAEAIWFGHSGPERLHKQKIYSYKGLEEFNRAFENSPSVMVLTTHCGNWELLGGFMNYNYTGLPFSFDEGNITVVYRPLSSGVWNDIMESNRCYSLRGSKFNGYVATEKVLRYAIEHRKEKRLYIFPTDQYPYKMATKHDVGEFMHQPTQTMTGAAALAHKFGMSVFYVTNRVVERGRYESELVEICPNAAEMTPEAIMERYYALLQAELEAQPWNYLWSHKRWK